MLQLAEGVQAFVPHQLAKGEPRKKLSWLILQNSLITDLVIFYK